MSVESLLFVRLCALNPQLPLAGVFDRSLFSNDEQARARQEFESCTCTTAITPLLIPVSSLLLRLQLDTNRLLIILQTISIGT